MEDFRNKNRLLVVYSGDDPATTSRFQYLAIYFIVIIISIHSNVARGSNHKKIYNYIRSIYDYIHRIRTEKNVINLHITCTAVLW